MDHEQFREEALKAVGLWGHPKANEIYAQAWKAHEFGLDEVMEHLEGLAEIELAYPVGPKNNN